jgi:hypothetical protein
MKHGLSTLFVFLALPAVAAAPRSFLGTCDVQIRFATGAMRKEGSSAGRIKARQAVKLTPRLVTHEKD